MHLCQFHKIEQYNVKIIGSDSKPVAYLDHHGPLYTLYIEDSQVIISKFIFLSLKINSVYLDYAIFHLSNHCLPKYV